jgi:hypothetical protein
MSDAKPTPYTPEWVNKTDVANRQLCAAVRMFFERRDPVVAHSIISAGHQILTDLCKLKGIDAPRLRGKQKSGEEVSRINVAANFFKHADRDADGRINIEPLAEFNAEFLMDAAFMALNLFGNDTPMEMKIYCSWFVSKHPDLFKNVKSVPRFDEFGIPVDDFKSIAALLLFNEIATSLPPEPA